MKKKVVAGILLAVALSTVACGNNAGNTESSSLENAIASWQEQYDLGMRYLEEGDYEQAIVAFTAAIEIDPKEASIYIARGDAYIVWAEIDNVENPEEKYQAALADYEEAKTLDSQENVEEKIQYTQERIQEFPIEKSFKDENAEILEQLYFACQQNDDTQIWNFLWGPANEVLTNSWPENLQKVIYNLDEQNMGLYLIDKQLFVYIGEMNNRKRNGNGSWYSVSGDSELAFQSKYEGQWSNDLPNGDGSYTEAMYTGETLNSKEIIQGGYIEGKCNGDMTIIFEDDNSMTFQYSMDNGKGQVIDENEENDLGFKAVSYTYVDNIKYYLGVMNASEEGQYDYGIWPYGRVEYARWSNGD